MAADFGLSNSVTLPSKVTPFEPIDAVGNTAAAYSLAGKMVDTRQKIDEDTQRRQDQEILKQYSSQDGTDLVTPMGLSKAAKELQGKLSPTSLQSLVGAAQKSQQADQQYRLGIAKAGEAELALQASEIDTSYSVLSPLAAKYAEDKAAKGEIYAREEFNKNKVAALQQLSQAKTPNGQPMVSPNTVQMLGQLDADHLGGAMNMTKSHGELLKNRLNEERAKAQAAIVAGGGAGKGSPTELERYQTMLAEGKITQDDYDNLAAGFMKRKGAASPATGVDWEKDPPTVAEQAEADKYVLTGRMPQVGTGGQAAAKRLRILELANQRADKMGLAPEQVVQLQMKTKQSAEALKRLITQSSTIQAGEKNIVGVLNILKGEVEKLGGPQSPKIKRFLNKAQTEWRGDPDFVGINQAYLDVIENAARVYSGVTGAAGTPVSFLELAKDSLPNNPSLAQVLKLQEVMPKLFAVRRKATEDEMDVVSKMASLPKARGDSTRIDPRVQAERDAAGGEQSVASASDIAKNKFGNDVEKARAQLRQDREALRQMKATKGSEVSNILEMSIRDTENAIKHMESSKPKEITSKSGKKFTVTVE